MAGEEDREVEDEEVNDDVNEDVDNDTDQDDEDDAPVGVLTEADFDRIAATAREAAESVADRRINQILKRRPKDEDADDDDKAPKGRRTRDDIRYFKLAIRDALEDVPEDVRSQVRAAALDMAPDYDFGDDEDEAANRLVARLTKLASPPSKDNGKNGSLRKRGDREDSNEATGGQKAKRKTSAGDSKIDQFKAGQKAAADRFGTTKT